MKLFIRELRKSLGISQVSFSKAIGISQSALSAIESGRHFPRQEIIDKICSVYSVSREQVISDQEDFEKSPRFFIEVGKQYGRIFIDAQYQKGEGGKKYKHYDCHCIDCGKKFCMSGSAVMQIARRGCSGCNRKAKKTHQRTSYVGQNFGNIEVTDVLGSRKIYGVQQLFVKGKCLLCGEEAEYPIARLKSQLPISCARCAKSNWLEKGTETNKKIHINGTNIASITNRKNGKVNKNNSSGVNGVCRGKSGKWRAYIVLRGKQYYLGNFSELDDAIAARKNAEKKFFDPEIIKFVDQNPKTWKKLLKADQQPDNSNDKSNAKI